MSRGKAVQTRQRLRTLEFQKIDSAARVPSGIVHCPDCVGGRVGARSLLSCYRILTTVFRGLKKKFLRNPVSFDIHEKPHVEGELALSLRAFNIVYEENNLPAQQCSADRAKSANGPRWPERVTARSSSPTSRVVRNQRKRCVHFLRCREFVNDVLKITSGLLVGIERTVLFGKLTKL